MSLHVEDAVSPNHLKREPLVCRRSCRPLLVVAPVASVFGALLAVFQANDLVHGRVLDGNLVSRLVGRTTDAIRNEIFEEARVFERLFGVRNSEVLQNSIERTQADGEECPPKHVDKDFPGHDMNAIYKSASYGECWQYCSETPGCLAVTWDQRQEMCFPKNKPIFDNHTGLVNHRGLISGSTVTISQKPPGYDRAARGPDAGRAHKAGCLSSCKDFFSAVKATVKYSAWAKTACPYYCKVMDPWDEFPWSAQGFFYRKPCHGAYDATKTMAALVLPMVNTMIEYDTSGNRMKLESGDIVGLEACLAGFPKLVYKNGFLWQFFEQKRLLELLFRARNSEGPDMKHGLGAVDPNMFREQKRLLLLEQKRSLDLIRERNSEGRNPHMKHGLGRKHGLGAVDPNMASEWTNIKN